MYNTHQGASLERRERLIPTMVPLWVVRVGYIPTRVPLWVVKDGYTHQGVHRV